MENTNRSLDEIINSFEEQIITDIITSKEKNNEDDTEWILLMRNKKQSDRYLDEIFKKSEELMMSPEILNIVKRYFNTTVYKQKTVKRNIRKSIMCASICLAFSVTKNFRDENQIKNFFNISDSKYNKAIKLVKLAVPETRNIKKCYENEIFKICSDIGVHSEIEDIKIFLRKFLETNYGNKILKVKNIKQRHIFFIAMYIWLIINKRYIISIKEYSKMTELTRTFIIKSIKESSEIKEHLNSCFNNYTKNFLKIVSEKYSKKIEPENYGHLLSEIFFNLLKKITFN